MTIYEYVSSIVSLAALIAVVVSLWLLNRQVRLMNEQTAHLTKTLEISAESMLDTLFVAITQAYLEHPPLRAIFNEREVNEPVTLADHDMRLRANALAETILDAIDRALAYEERDLPGCAFQLRAWINDSFRDSTFLRSWFDQHAAWYSQALRAIAEDVQRSFTPTPAG